MPDVQLNVLHNEIDARNKYLMKDYLQRSTKLIPIILRKSQRILDRIKNIELIINDFYEEKRRYALVQSPTEEAQIGNQNENGIYYFIC